MRCGFRCELLIIVKGKFVGVEEVRGFGVRCWMGYLYGIYVIGRS